MLQRFKDYIARQDILQTRRTVLLAVSGGRDSVCLVDLMHAAGYSFAIAHCNFHLRGEESNRDQRFVADMAHRLGVPFHTADFDTRTVAAEQGLSVEEAARELRYRWFSSLCREHRYPCLVTAHHADDSVETFFLNLFRGTGISGLHGIRPSVSSYGVYIVRPMLAFSRADIDKYISAHNLPFVEDSTNQELEARRNCIRHQLMPLLRNLYPSVDATLRDDIERLSETEEVYRNYINELRCRLELRCQLRFGIPAWYFNLDDLCKLEPRKTLMYELLQPFGFTPSVSAEVARSLPDARTGSRFLAPEFEAVFDRERLVLAERIDPAPPILKQRIIGRDQLPYLGFGRETPTVEYLDADLVRQPLSLRRWQPGDRFCPLGMERHRLVSDVLKDSKLNAIEKNHVFLLTDADGEIVWVVGVRTDHRFRVTETTRHALRLEVTRWRQLADCP